MAVLPHAPLFKGARARLGLNAAHRAQAVLPACGRRAGVWRIRNGRVGCGEREESCCCDTEETLPTLCRARAGRAWEVFVRKPPPCTPHPQTRPHCGHHPRRRTRRHPPHVTLTGHRTGWPLPSAGRSRKLGAARRPRRRPRTEKTRGRAAGGRARHGPPGLGGWRGWSGRARWAWPGRGRRALGGKRWRLLGRGRGKKKGDVEGSEFALLSLRPERRTEKRRAVRRGFRLSLSQP
jgi:hypothetical protein